MNFKRIALATAAAAALAFGSAGASAAPTTALWLAMDGSGSISDANFTIQITGYVAALNGFFAGTPAAYGKVAIGGNIFGRELFTFAGLKTIGDSVDLSALTTAISGLDSGRGGIDPSATAIGDAVTAGATALLAFEAAQQVDLRLVIDVTTDGFNNTGSDPVAASTAATAAGINAVNCLGIGLNANCAFIGSNGINFGTVSFEGLAAALEQKIRIETQIPEPMSLALVGIALAGLGLTRRRMAA